MNAQTQHCVEHLSLAECWELLDATSVGRLAVDIAGQPDIFPVNYVVDGESLVFRSGAGTKLAGAVLGEHVAFEIDGSRPADRTVWSVVVKGRAREISHMAERFAVDDLPLYPWVADPKPNFVRVEPTLVTGRRFRVAATAHPERHAGRATAAAEVAASEQARLIERSNLAVLPHGELPYHPGAPRLHPD